DHPRPRGHRGAGRASLRHAGDGALRARGHDPGLAGALQHARGAGRALRRSREGAGDLRLMAGLRELYQEVILDHNRKPRNFRRLGAPTAAAEGYNPLCGDRISVELEVEGDTLRDVAFQGSGCAISKASASMMTAALKGKTVSEAASAIGQC